MATKEPKKFKHHLEQIARIIEWFDSQQELDVEQALLNIEKLSSLIKMSKKKLAEIENNFKEIKKEVEKD